MTIPFAAAPDVRNARCRTAVSVLASAVVFILGACNSTKVTVDSLAKPDAENAVAYRIESKDPLIQEDSLRYQEAAAYVRTALSGKGMYEAPAAVKPQVVVELDFGVGPPITRMEKRSEPIYTQIPGQVRTEVRQGTDSVGRPTAYVVTVQEQSTREFSGVREYEVVSTVYEKYLRMTARENVDAAEGRPASEIWAVDVTSEGHSRNLRKTLPVLVAASIDYIGKDSRGQKTIKLKDTDPDVAFVKNGM